MRKLYNEREFDGEHIRCDRCGWEGRGDDANIVDFYGLARVQEVHCPNCDAYLAGVSKVDYRADHMPRRYGGDALSNQFG
jgi:hypothetical protein